MDNVAQGTKEHKPIPKLTLNSDDVKGLENFKVDEEGDMTIHFRVLKPIRRRNMG